MVSYELRPRNELLFRAVNEKLRAMNVEFEGFAQESALFVCECDRLDCMVEVEVPVAVFDAVSAQPGHFVVAPDHEPSELQSVVRRESRYVVVEKPGWAT